MDARRSIRSLAVARFASTAGSQAAQIALAFRVYEETGSAAWVSAALVASVGVVGLVGPVSGRLADRVDRQQLMVVTELAGAVGWVLVLAAPSPAALVIAVLVATAANAPFRAASAAAIASIAGPDDLSWANGTLATAGNAALVLGPLAGGALVGTVGPGAVFALNAVTFAVSAVVIARLRATTLVPPPQSDDVRGDAGRPASWHALLADRQRRRLYLVTALTFGAFGITLVSDLPLVDHFGGGSLAYALLTTLWGTGAVLGSVLASRIRGHEKRTMVLGTAAMALSLGSISVAPSLVVAIAVGAIGGLGSGLAAPPWFSLLQRATVDAQRGTAFAIADTFQQAAFITGMVAAGAAIAVLGPRGVYLLPGALLLVAARTATRLGSQPSTADQPQITAAVAS